MSLLEALPLDRLTPARLWSAIDADTRQSAARSLYDPEWDDAAARLEADAAIASVLRFRHEAVRRLPVGKRVGYLARAVRPDERLATELLRALHLGARSKMLGDFLDTLGIPQRGGVIESEDSLEAPSAEAIEAAAAKLRQAYPAPDVELYLATLLALDPDFWSGVSNVIRQNG